MITGSALRKLEAITGLKATQTSPACYKLEVSESVAFFSFKRDEKEAANELRQHNWKRVCRIVFEAQGWKCNECTKILPLQGHHWLFRSRWSKKDGPLDHEKNVVGLCQSCHETIHRPAPKVSI